MKLSKRFQALVHKVVIFVLLKILLQLSLVFVLDIFFDTVYVERDEFVRLQLCCRTPQLNPHTAEQIVISNGDVRTDDWVVLLDVVMNILVDALFPIR